jgi:hypothetical protein
MGLVLGLGLVGCGGDEPMDGEPVVRKLPAQPGQVITSFPIGSATSSYIGDDVSTVLRDPSGSTVLARVRWYDASNTFTWSVPGVGSYTGTNARSQVPSLTGGNYASAFLYDRIQRALAKTVLDDPGCDGVPDYFEGICVEECCAVHDACYAQNNCSWTSWLPFAGSAACDQCNDDVFTCIAFCFAPGGSGP